MAITPIVPKYGTAVTGKERYSRPALEAEFDSVMTGASGARVFGLRRIGKSTEAQACRQRLEEAGAGLTLVNINAEGYTSEAKLLQDILSALPTIGLLGRITTVLHADNSIAQAAREAIQKALGSHADIQAYFGPIMQAVENAIEANDKVILLIDEFPWLCRSILESDHANGRNRVDVLLAALRRWRGKGVRMMLIGSIGMAALCRQYALDPNHLLDMLPIETPPLALDEARSFVEALVLGSGIKDWTNDHTDALLEECTALYPSFIQLAFQHLSIGHRAVALDRIADIFADRIRSDQDSTFFAQFDRRLKLYCDLPAPMPQLLPLLLTHIMRQPGQTANHPALRAAADAPVGSAVSEADLGDALAILREDGFLSLRAPKNAPQEWRAASGLVKAWWAQRHGGVC